MSNLNQLTYIGRVASDPEMRYSPSGTAVLRLLVASNRAYQVEGEWQEKATFIPFSLFGKKAERANETIGKGDLVMVLASIENNSYEKDGKTVHGYNFPVFRCSILSKKQSSDEQGGSNQNSVRPESRAKPVQDNDNPFA